MLLSLTPTPNRSLNNTPIPPTLPSLAADFSTNQAFPDPCVQLPQSTSQPRHTACVTTGTPSLKHTRKVCPVPPARGSALFT